MSLERFGRPTRFDSLRYPRFPDRAWSEAREVRYPKETEQRSEAIGFTIDPEGSPDLDDAVYVKRVDDGYIVLVSVADVGSVVDKNSEIDKEAGRRGVTRYYPDGTNSPMLPPRLSEDLLSLKDDYHRPAITIGMHLDDSLNPVSARIEPTRIKSLRRFTYQEADEAILNEKDGEHSVLNLAFTVANNLYKKRKSEGAIAMFDIMDGFFINDEGKLVGLNSDSRHMSHLIIQEFMVLANKTVADYFIENSIPGLFRNHIREGLDEDWNSIQREINDIEAGDEVTAENLNSLRERLGGYLGRAGYSPVNRGHASLNISAYLRVTSPIRRMADLVNQRMLAASIRGEELPYTVEELEILSRSLEPLERGVKNTRSGIVVESPISEENFEQLDRLPAHTFSSLIYTAAREGKVTARLNEEILRRMKSGRKKLSEKDLYLLLLAHKGQDETWESLHEAIIQHLSIHPSSAVSIANDAKQLLGWSAVKYEVSKSGPQHASIFSVGAEVTIDGEKIHSRVVKASSKKLAEQLAVLDILSSVTGIQYDISEKESIRIPKEGVVNIEYQDNLYGRKNDFKNMLDQERSRRGWSKPDYATIEEESSDGLVYTTVVRIVQEGEEIVSEPMSAKTKVDAERLAAENLLMELGVDVADKPKSVKPINVTPGGYTQAIGEIADRYGWHRPKFRIEESPADRGGKYMCTYRFYTTKSVIVLEYRSNTEEGIESKAARAVFDELIKRYGIPYLFTQPKSRN